MKQRLLALAATVAALGAGTVVFLNWESGALEAQLADVGNWEAIDRDSCSMRACNASSCVQAQNVLADAGSACLTRFVACDFRVGPALRNRAADAGVTLGPKKYQRIELIALRCPAIDGGFSFGVPMDDSGWPIYAVTPNVTPRCVRAPAGNSTCLRALSDGGTRFFGELNVFPAAEARGTGCEPCGCTVMFGDDPAVDL